MEKQHHMVGAECLFYPNVTTDLFDSGHDC